MTDHQTFYSGKNGKNLLVFGAVHGNEKCGTKAIKKIISEIENGEILLQSGTVTFVPVANPKAYDEHVRYIDKNLNRIFFKDYECHSYEASIVGDLIKLIDECDYFLDLHSYSYGKGPFMFQDNETPETDEFAASFNISPILTGWKALHGEDGPRTSTDYALTAGKAGVTIECGQHDDPDAVPVAYNAIKDALSFLCITEKSEEQDKEKGHKVRLMSQVIKVEEGDMIKDWQNMDPITEGELIAITASGQEIIAPHNGYIIMPHHTQKIGEEWFYTAVAA